MARGARFLDPLKLEIATSMFEKILNKHIRGGHLHSLDSLVHVDGVFAGNDLVNGVTSLSVLFPLHHFTWKNNSRSNQKNRIISGDLSSDRLVSAIYSYTPLEGVI